MQSAKTIGKHVTEPRVVKKEEEVAQESEADNAEQVEEEKVERPMVDQSIMDFYELKGEQLEQTYNALRRDINDEAKKRAIDSDDDAVKEREMRKQNEKLTFINKFDSENFSAEKPTDKP